MTKQVINVGTTANDKKGDSLRAAFQKVNTNFTELYTALGLNADTTLNLGAFEFAGSTISTTDSTAIVIDQTVTISSDLNVGGDILPNVAQGGNLGSLDKPFKSLYVSTSTVYLGGVPLSLDPSNTLLVNNAPISTRIEYTSIPNAPQDISDLTDTTNLLGGDTGLIRFTNGVIHTAAGQNLTIDPSNDSGNRIVIPGPGNGVNFPLSLNNTEGNVTLNAGSGDGGTGAGITLHYGGGEGDGYEFRGNIDIFAGVDGGGVADNDYNADIGKIRLRTGPYTGAGYNEWKFDAKGTLSLPNSLKIGPISGVPTIYTTSGNLVVGSNSDLILSTLDGDYDWTFDGNGWLTVPANTGLLGVIDEDIKIRARDHEGDGFAVMQEVLDSGDFVRGRTQLERDEFRVEFYNSSGTQISYNRFREDRLEIANDIEVVGGSSNYFISSADNNSTLALKVIDSSSVVQGYISLKASEVKLATGAGANTLAFGSTGLTSNNDLAIRVPSGIPSGVSAITGSSGSWEMNPMSNLATTTDGSGSGLRVNVTENGGYADTISIATAGTGYTNGDTITVTSGSSNATFTITVPVATWEFDSGGDLTLPASGDVLDSTGVSQLANRVEGSWTVTTGTATYSFTVPMDGTYTMWVKGNIPNGIITWNATLSVTNSNVPAIGSQYAWNYTGGGSPILLTAIPDQVRGAAGTISTDATYAGSTSNRFDFGISNSSGSSRTVYYGYIKI